MAQVHSWKAMRGAVDPRDKEGAIQVVKDREYTALESPTGIIYSGVRIVQCVCVREIGMLSFRRSG